MQSQEGQKKNYIHSDEQLGVTVRGYICQSQSSLGNGATLSVHWWQLDLPEMWGQLGKRKLEEGLDATDSSRGEGTHTDDPKYTR